MMEFRSSSHKLKVIPAKKGYQPGPFETQGPYGPGARVILEIEIVPEHHHMVEALEFRKNNMTNTWAATS